MIDPSDRIVRINEVLAALNEQPEIPPSIPPGPKLTDEEKAKQAAEKAARLKAAQDAADIRQQEKFNDEISDVEELKKKGISNATRFYPDVTMKGKERREALRGYMDFLRSDPERLRLFKQQKAYASAEMVGQAQRARTAYDRSAANTAERIAAYQRQQALNRAATISQHSPGLAEPLVAAAEASAEARAAERNLGNIIKSTKSLAQIKAENLRGRESLERQERAKNLPGYSELTPTPEQQSEIDARLLTKGTGDMESRRVGQLGKQSSATSPAQTGYEFYNRNTGQIERSDAPGVDRVFRDSSGKAYRIEGGSGRKVYV